MSLEYPREPNHDAVENTILLPANESFLDEMSGPQSMLIVPHPFHDLQGSKHSSKEVQTVEREFRGVAVQTEQQVEESTSSSQPSTSYRQIFREMFLILQSAQETS